MHILFRTDASRDIGTGHVMRCIALASALQETGSRVSFLCKELPESLRTRLDEEKCALTMLKGDDAAATLKTANDLGAEWIVIDGYHFDAAYVDAIKKSGVKMLLIDDEGTQGHYNVDAVLNQNAYANAKMYGKTNAMLLLGPRFALLRKEFWKLQGRERLYAESAKKILVTLGGSDPKNVTKAVLTALSGIKEKLKITVVLGGSYLFKQEIDALASLSVQEVTVLQNVQNMAELFQNADLAITAGGTTCYEMAFLGTPMITIVLAENQRMNSRALEKAGCSLELGTAEDLDAKRLVTEVSSLLRDAKRRTKMGKEGRTLVDGEGALRVAQQMMTGKSIHLRMARTEDVQHIFEWSNDPESRKASFNSDPIPWETHTAWYEASLKNHDRLFLIAVDGNNTPVGQIRFDRGEDGATLSISLDPKERGKGLGKELVILGARRLFLTTNAHRIHAYVKSENTASAALFQKTGFTELPEARIKDIPARHFVLDRAMLGL